MIQPDVLYLSVTRRQFSSFTQSDFERTATEIAARKHGLRPTFK